MLFADRKHLPEWKLLQGINLFRVLKDSAERFLKEEKITLDIDIGIATFFSPSFFLSIIYFLLPIWHMDKLGFLYIGVNFVRKRNGFEVGFTSKRTGFMA